ncbi:MAG: aminoglycoside phosphotransferase family protein [Alphaproteobacteria bacterium]|nr:aminoglycoside phosphotransferase family protein [Alphaproteobacteria bacterium]
MNGCANPHDVALRLIGHAPDAVSAVAGGGNNRLYRVVSRRNVFALKYYPADERDRLGAEFGGLEFLVRHGIDAVPRPIAADAGERMALYEWIDGDKPEDFSAADLDAVFAFIARLDELGSEGDAAGLPPASAACLTYGSPFDQLDRRFDRLRSHAAPYPALTAFLEGKLVRTRDTLKERYLGLLAATGLGLHEALPPSQRFLSPSDFGRHNLLRRADGRLVFLDFEYFGWDDPVKFACDFALHPGSGFPAVTQAALLSRANAQFAPRDRFFTARMNGLIGVFGLIWCLIMLNEFVPDSWLRRAVAGRGGDREASLRHQLLKAERLYSQIQELINAGQTF